MNVAQRTFIILGSGLALLAACTTNTTNNNGGTSGGTSGSAPVPQADCNTRCKAKATTCGATAAQADQGCGQICTSYTVDQLSCLEGKSCDQLQNASLSTLCPAAPGSSSGTSGTSGASSGTSGTSGTTTKFSCSLNGTCYKCDSSEGVQKCSITTGPGPGCTKTDTSYCEE